MKCRDCKKYRKTGTSGHGVCSLPYSYFLVEDNDECHYLKTDDLKCKDCDRFKSDFACFTSDENDNASDCACFIDKQKCHILDVFWTWFKRGTYSREKIMKLCDEFEQSEEYKFFQTLNKEDNLNGK